MNADLISNQSSLTLVATESSCIAWFPDLRLSAQICGEGFVFYESFRIGSRQQAKDIGMKKSLPLIDADNFLSQSQSCSASSVSEENLPLCLPGFLIRVHPRKSAVRFCSS